MAAIRSSRRRQAQRASRAHADLPNSEHSRRSRRLQHLAPTHGLLDEQTQRARPRNGADHSILRSVTVTRGAAARSAAPDNSGRNAPRDGEAHGVIHGISSRNATEDSVPAPASLASTFNQGAHQVREAAAAVGHGRQGEPSSITLVEYESLCIVCFELRPICCFRRFAGCSHRPEICGSCVYQHIQVTAENPRCARVTCPSPNCAVDLTLDELRTFASSDVAARIDNQLLRNALDADPDFFRCLNPRCNDGHFHFTGEDGNIFQCRTCGHKACISHKRPWHVGETCDQYDARNERQVQEALSTAMIKATFKQCPQCRRRYEKTDGCDHMTCTCGHEFCNVCLAPRSEVRRIGDWGHEKSCRHYPQRARPARDIRPLPPPRTLVDVESERAEVARNAPTGSDDKRAPRTARDANRNAPTRDKDNRAGNEEHI